MKYAHAYRALKALGFSAFKSAEIVLDARRRDKHARQMIGLAFKLRRSS